MSGAIKPGLVSVVVASYNHAEFLEQRMNSLINQTYRDIEILVIDDCSPDNSVEILRRYESHPKVRLIIREKNGGWVAVSNQGVEMSTGEFVIFANCDDACDPSMIERLVGAINQNQTAGVAFCRSLMIDEQDRVLGDDYEIREKSFRERCAADTFIGRNEMYRFLLHSCVIPNLSAALIRRSCFDLAGSLTSDYRACSDWDLFFRIANDFDFCYVSEPLNRFRQHSTTIRSATKGRITYDEFFRLLLGEIRRDKLSPGERFHFRLHVMYLWAIELIRPSAAGWVNFFHHWRLVWRIDRLALPVLPLAILQRLIELPVKVVWRFTDKINQTMSRGKRS
jgi:glycosyltransferase involved in cell wall biosynthesis